MSTKTAIVTCYRGAAPILDSFLRYHFALGFDHVFLFSEDPQDPGNEIARRYPGVTVVPYDDELRARWRGTEQYRARPEWYEAHLENELIPRQELNVELAVGMAREQGVDWLLHIDADELFHCPGTTVEAHFRGLAEEGCAVMRYLNHEAAPERADVVDCHREVTLFKKHSRTHPGGKFTEEQKRVMESIPACPPGLFHFYKNGKAAARVTPGLHPAGPHSFTPALERRPLYRLQKRVARTRPLRWLRERGVAPRLRRFLLRDGAVRVGGVADPCILHLPCCTFEVFWEKYRIHGRFHDQWFGTKGVRYGKVPTHLDSRDVVMQGDKALAEAFYRERFVVGAEDAARLLECGLAERVRAPSELLAALPQPVLRSPAEIPLIVAAME